MKKFKVSVSDWSLKFSNGEKIYFKDVIKEKVELYADGRSKICLKNASFNSKFIDLFKKGAKLTNICQRFDLMDSNNRLYTDFNYCYPNMMIDKVSIIGSSTTVDTVDVVFKSARNIDYKEEK